MQIQFSAEKAHASHAAPVDCARPDLSQPPFVTELWSSEPSKYTVTAVAVMSGGSRETKTETNVQTTVTTTIAKSVARVESAQNAYAAGELFDRPRPHQAGLTYQNTRIESGWPFYTKNFGSENLEIFQIVFFRVSNGRPLHESIRVRYVDPDRQRLRRQCTWGYQCIVVVNFICVKSTHFHVEHTQLTNGKYV